MFQKQDADLVFDDNQHAIFNDDNSLNTDSDSLRTNLVSKRSVSDSNSELYDNQFEEEENEHWLSRLTRNVKDFWNSDSKVEEKPQKHKKKKERFLKDEGFEIVHKKVKNIDKTPKYSKKIARAAGNKPIRDIK